LLHGSWGYRPQYSPSPASTQHPLLPEDSVSLARNDGHVHPSTRPPSPTNGNNSRPDSSFGVDSKTGRAIFENGSNKYSLQLYDRNVPLGRPNGPTSARPGGLKGPSVAAGGRSTPVPSRLSHASIPQVQPSNPKLGNHSVQSVAPKSSMPLAVPRSIASITLPSIGQELSGNNQGQVGPQTMNFSYNPQIANLDQQYGQGHHRSPGPPIVPPQPIPASRASSNPAPGDGALSEGNEAEAEGNTEEAAKEPARKKQRR
jgi:hypothetical protein